MADLSVNIGELQMNNPVMTASGTFGYGEEFADFIELSRIGGIIVKGTTLHKREGNPYPRMAETPSGMLNAVGLQNKGVHYFVEHIYPRIKDIQTNMIVNVSGSAIEDYAETAAIINELDKIPAIELNISCPNVRSRRSGESRALSLQKDTYRKALTERYRHHRNSPRSRKWRCRQCFPHQYPAGNGYRRGTQASDTLHCNRWHVRCGRETHCLTYGMASSQSGKNPRHRLGRYHELERCCGIHACRCLCHPDWYGKLH